MPDIASSNFTNRLPSLREVRISSGMLWCAVLMVAVGFITQRLSADYPKDAPLHDDLFSPVLALELPHAPQDLKIVISPPLRLIAPREESAKDAEDREITWQAQQQVRENQIRTLFLRATISDFFFIAAYTSFLLIAWKAIVPVGHTIVTWLIVVVAASDVMENIGILRALATPLASLNNASVSAIYWPSIIKWSAYVLVVLCFGLALTRIELKPFRRPGTGVLAIELIVSAVVGATGLRPDIPVDGFTGLFSHGHLETFVVLLAAFPLTVIVAEIYRRLFRSEGAPASPPPAVTA